MVKDIYVGASRLSVRALCVHKLNLILLYSRPSIDLIVYAGLENVEAWPGTLCTKTSGGQSYSYKVTSLRN
jgi:hypothetical protein